MTSNAEVFGDNQCSCAKGATNRRQIGAANPSFTNVHVDSLIVVSNILVIACEASSLRLNVQKLMPLLLRSSAKMCSNMGLVFAVSVEHSASSLAATIRNMRLRGSRKLLTLDG